MPHSYNMRYEHFLLFTYGIVRAQSESSCSRKTGSFVGGVSTASNSVIGFMYTKGTRHSFKGRVLLTLTLKKQPLKGISDHVLLFLA